MKGLFLASLLLVGGIRDGESLRFTYAWEQGFDDSCGFQCLACLIGLYWGMPVTEWDLAVQRAELKEGKASAAGAAPGSGLAVTLEDLLGLARSRGFLAEAWTTDYAGLVGAACDYAPLIAHYSRPLGHFVIVLAADEELVAVADPAAGLSLLARQDFEGRWSGAILLAAFPGRAADSAILAQALASLGGTLSLFESGRMLSRMDIP